MNKKKLSERDICTKFITPAITRGGWDVQTQVREQVHLTRGRVIVRGKLVARGEQKYADYVLYWKPNIPVGVIEAKDNNHTIGAGMQQALNYAEMLDVSFVFSSNGGSFLLHDRTGQTKPVEREFGLDATANAHVERFVGSLRRECLDHVLLLGEDHLQRVLTDYRSYFNTARPHQGINQRRPAAFNSPPLSPQFVLGTMVEAHSVLGGLHHDYRLAAQAHTGSRMGEVARPG